MMEKALKRVGINFSNWTVLEIYQGGKHKKCLARCRCGNVKVVDLGNIKSGKSKSCGCVMKEVLSKKFKKPGRSWPEYAVWLTMRARCINPNNANYRNYGGRGIEVCERWAKSYEDFIADMGRRPSPNHSIERINNNGHYEPLNCRWATNLEQAKNKRRTKLVNFNGKLIAYSELCKKLAINLNSFRNRIYAYEETPQKAVEYLLAVERGI